LAVIDQIRTGLIDAQRKINSNFINQRTICQRDNIKMLKTPSAKRPPPDSLTILNIDLK